MPIMVGSNKCNMAGFSDDELIDIGEDPVDPGGYFIVNGSERVLMTSEDLAPNKILAEYDSKVRRRDPGRKDVLPTPRVPCAGALRAQP